MTSTSQGREQVSTARPAARERHHTLPQDPGEAWRLYRHVRAELIVLKRHARQTHIHDQHQQIAQASARVLAMRNELVERALPVLAQVTERLKLTLPSFIDRDDLYLSGVPALIRTVERYRPARGFRFDTFAVPRLRGAILDELRRMDHVPRLARKRNQVRAEAIQGFLKAHGRPPDETETLAAIEQCGGTDDTKEHQRVLKEKPIPGSVSIDKPVQAGRGADTLTLAEQLRADSRDPLTQAQRADLKRFITERLPRRERLIIMLYYFENMTMQEVGASLGISESRVSQSMKQLLEQLQARLSSRASELEP